MEMHNMDLIKGIGIGLIAGGAISIALTSGKRRQRKCKNHTIRAIGDVVDNVTDMLGF
ncbi:MAG: hypothetical protein FWD84_04895 [Oscillospiraceae bacterium]|nr:hypothetical protein [Oscillospiraceae bacterium]